jgi:hypothetical protein
MFETVPRRVTAYSVLDIIEGTLDLNAGAPRITDWLQSGYDWLVLREARVTPRGSDEAAELPRMRVNLARVECLIDEGEPVSDERFLAPRTKTRIDLRFPSGLIVSGLLSLPEGATWVTAMDVIDDDDRLKPLEESILVWDRQVVRSGVTAFVRLKAALYAREDVNGEFIRRLVGDVPELGAAPAAPSAPSAPSATAPGETAPAD